MQLCFGCRSGHAVTVNPTDPKKAWVMPAILAGNYMFIGLMSQMLFALNISSGHDKQQSCEFGV